MGKVLLARHRLDALADDAIILIEDMWAEHDDPDIRKAWAEAMDELGTRSYRLVRVPMEAQCLTVVDDPQRADARRAASRATIRTSSEAPSSSARRVWTLPRTSAK